MINKFSNEYSWLSNFHRCNIILDGVQYHSVENAYQAAKTLDINERIQFQNITPGKAKKRGAKLNLRSDWEQQKISIMRALLNDKFKVRELRQKLINTGDVQIIEGNNWNDTYWGVCNGKGKNMLGILLMTIRMEINKELVSWA